MLSRPIIKLRSYRRNLASARQMSYGQQSIVAPVFSGPLWTDKVSHDNPSAHAAIVPFLYRVAFFSFSPLPAPSLFPSLFFLLNVFPIAIELWRRRIPSVTCKQNTYYICIYIQIYVYVYTYICVKWVIADKFRVFKFKSDGYIFFLSFFLFINIQTKVLKN